MTGPIGVEELLRELAPQVLSILVRRFGDFDAAEDVLQEALVAAAVSWPQDGVPDNPRGWLIHTAANRMTDLLRSDSARKRREQLAALRDLPADGAPDSDDTLLLLFMCCHPALSTTSAIALTLRAVGGLTTAEIAKAFIVPEATMAQRISRAKSKIKASGTPLRIDPSTGEWAQRLASVLHVLYLIFNEGYTSSAGADLHRGALSEEAIRLARMVHRMLPEDGEVTGLLALMLLTDARRPARVTAGGDLVPLAEQDRSRWDRKLIEEGVALLAGAVTGEAIREYRLMAIIAAVHDQAEDAKDTDWPQILAVYGLLEQRGHNPVVTLNRAIAAAMVYGPNAGLALLDTLDKRLTTTHRLDAVRAHLYEMAGDTPAAIAAYRAAAARTTNMPEQTYLLLKAAQLAERGRAAAGRHASGGGPTR